MTKLLSSHHLTAAALGLLLPAFAAAWTPYGPSPYDNPNAIAEPPAEAGAATPTAPPPNMPGYGHTPYGAGPGFPGRPFGYGPWTMPGPGFAPGFGLPANPEQLSARGGPPRFSLARSATDDAYILDIRLSNMEPTQIQVDIQGPWIRISSQNTREDTREERFDDGYGYVRSFSYSSGRNSRRIALPRDADAAAMTREDGTDSVRISLPRKSR